MPDVVRVVISDHAVSRAKERYGDWFTHDDAWVIAEACVAGRACLVKSGIMHLTYRDPALDTTPDRPSEVEITPEMMEAGLAAFRLWEWGDDPEWAVEWVYRDMETARRARATTAPPGPAQEVAAHIPRTDAD
jgi:hypothetical protein